MNSQLSSIKLRQLISQRKRNMSDCLRSDLRIVYWGKSATLDSTFLSRAQFALSTQTGNNIVFQINDINDDIVETWNVPRSEFIEAFGVWVDTYNRAIARYDAAITKLATLRSPTAVFEEMAECVQS